jgi:hypothetical protein
MLFPVALHRLGTILFSDGPHIGGFSSGMLRCVDWWLLGDISGRTVSLILKQSKKNFGLGCLPVEGGTNRLSQNIST